jgi:hypothetical protein
MARRVLATLVAAVVAATLVAAPVTMADWGEQVSLSAERVDADQVDPETPVLRFEELSPETQSVVARAIDSDGSVVVYGDEDAPERFAYSDYTAPGHGLYAVVYDGEYYRLRTYAAGGFPFVYWLLELPFVAYGAGLGWVAHRTDRGRQSPSHALALAGVGLGFHALGPAFDFPLVAGTAFAALGVLGTAVLAGVVWWSKATPPDADADADAA